MVKPNNYKTMMCKYYLQGFCINTVNCTFIHGAEDNPMINMSPYKISNPQPL